MGDEREMNMHARTIGSVAVGLMLLVALVVMFSHNQDANPATGASEIQLSWFSSAWNSAKSDVSSDVKKVKSDGSSDVKKVKSDVKKVKNGVSSLESKIKSDADKVGSAIKSDVDKLSKKLKAELPLLCERAVGWALKKVVGKVEDSACDWVCAEAGAMADSMGAGPEDPVADAVATGLGLACGHLCEYALEKLGDPGIDDISDYICTKIPW